MIKRVDRSVYMTISDLEDNEFTSGVQVYDLGTDGVGSI